MSNVRFWNEVMNKLDNRLTDEAASNLYFYQKSQDAEISEYISDSYNGITGKVRKRNGMIGFAACIAVIVCLAVVIGVILQNNVAVQPLDSNNEYSYLLETEKYTYKTNVYFLTRELGEEYLEHTDILDNQLILNSVETCILAADFKNEYYIFGNAEREEELTKYYFDDPIGGKDGMQKNGWLINFSPDLLEFICEDNRLKDFCNSRFDREGIDRKIEEITDVYIVCIPGMAALIHFEDGGQTYFLHHTQNAFYDDNVPFDIFSREELVDYYALKERPVTINQKEILNGVVVGNMAGATEVNVTKLLEHIVDEEFIVREGSKTSYYMWDMKTGKKNLYMVTDSEAKTIETYYESSVNPVRDNTFWNKDGSETLFRDGDVFMNYKATEILLGRYDVYLDYSDDGYLIEYNATSNSFTSDTRFIPLQNVDITFNDHNIIYANSDELCVSFSSRIPFSEVYNGLKIEYELVIKDNGKPVLINGKESYKFSAELKSDDENTEYEVYQDELYIDTAGITFNEYGYSTELMAYLTYTVDASQVISGRIETNTREDYLLIRNNPDNLTEEGLIATTPVISKCKKQDTGVWELTVDFSRIKKIDKDTKFAVQFIDEKNNKPVRMSNKVGNDEYITNFSFGKDEEPVADIILYNEYEEPKLLLYMQSADNIVSNFYYRENFILTD
ncbi:MAG: hypothetical protein IJZ51_07325 [Ruminiclostridium sp.]|nr:hypothetical protein [Ruminiclostridium sp.]